MGPLDEAILKAINLEEKTRGEGIARAFDELDTQLRSFEQGGYPLEALFIEGDSGMGAGLTAADRKGFWTAYQKLLCAKLCRKDSDLRRLTESGLSASVGAVLTVVVSSFSVPIAALSIMVPIAVIITTTGLDAFCQGHDSGSAS